MSFSIFENMTNVPKYNNQFIVNMIKVIRMLTEKKPNSKKIQKLKLEIFMMTKMIVIKNINNYIKYSTNSSISEQTNNPIEMESEAYLVFENCIKQFKYQYDFYFYFNKSLARTFYRTFDKEKRMNDKDLIYKSDLVHRHKTSFSVNDFEIDIFNIGLDELDIIVLRSKMADETKDMFFKNNPKFPSAKYYECSKKIKNLLTTLRDNDEL